VGAGDRRREWSTHPGAIGAKSGQEPARLMEGWRCIERQKRHRRRRAFFCRLSFLRASPLPSFPSEDEREGKGEGVSWEQERAKGARRPGGGRRRRPGGAHWLGMRGPRALRPWRPGTWTSRRRRAWGGRKV